MRNASEEGLFLLDGDLHLLYKEQTEGLLFFLVERRSFSAVCPGCQRTSQRIHSRYTRKVNDLPVADRQVNIQVLLHKWFCDNPDCPTKIFTERLPWLQSYKRRTERLEEMIEKIAFSTNCLTAEKICRNLHVSVSHDTLLRRVRVADFDLSPSPFRRNR